MFFYYVSGTEPESRETSPPDDEDGLETDEGLAADPLTGAVAHLTSPTARESSVDIEAGVVSVRAFQYTA